MNYIAKFKSKDAAWYIFKRLKDAARHTNQENDVQIKDSTLMIPEYKISELERLAEKINAPYHTKTG